MPAARRHHLCLPILSDAAFSDLDDHVRCASSSARGCTRQEGCAVTGDTLKCDGRHSGSRPERA